MVERGWLRAGDRLFNQGRGPDGGGKPPDGGLLASTLAGAYRGSIHQVGAAVQGAPACNGWLFWHFDMEGAVKPIDMLRQKIRSEIATH